ncbi:unnamed protein product [Lampetra fluviatilis]
MGAESETWRWAPLCADSAEHLVRCAASTWARGEDAGGRAGTGSPSSTLPLRPGRGHVVWGEEGDLLLFVRVREANTNAASIMKGTGDPPGIPRGSSEAKEPRSAMRAATGGQTLAPPPPLVLFLLFLLFLLRREIREDKEEGGWECGDRRGREGVIVSSSSRHATVDILTGTWPVEE